MYERKKRERREEGKAGRVGVKSLEDGRKVRVFKANGEQVDA